MAKKLRKGTTKPKERDEDVEFEEVDGSKLTAEDFLHKNRNILLVAVSVIAILIVAFIVVKSQRNARNTAANEQMFRAINYFEEDSLDKALMGDGEYPGFEEIVDSYGGTKAGNQARYYLGIINLRKGLTEDGISYLKKFKKGDDLLSVSANMALGFAYEDLNEPSTAAGFFEKAASTVGENDFSTPMMLLHAGMNFEAAGNPSKALKLYKEIKEKFPESDEGRNIDKYIGRVSP